MNNSNTNEHNWAKVVKKWPTTKIKSHDLILLQIQVHQVLPAVSQFFYQHFVQGDGIRTDPQADSQEVAVPVQLFLIHRKLESRIVFFNLFHFA